MPNKIITIGMGPSAGNPGRSALITYGYGPPPFITELIRRAVVNGGSSKSSKQRYRELEPVVVWAKLIEINGLVPQVKVQDYSKSYLDQSNTNPVKDVSFVSSGIKDVWENIKFSIKRIK